jgi:hypothetical protein
MLSVGPIGQTVHDLLAGFLSDHNYIAGRDIPGYSKLCVRFLDTLIRARQIVEDRNAGRLWSANIRRSSQPVNLHPRCEPCGMIERCCAS